MDDHGLQPDALEEALSRSRARVVVVVQPLFQNPTGATVPAARQTHILEFAQRHRAIVVEDDFARYMAHSDRPPLPPAMITRDPHGSVIHIRSLTKITSPNLRVAAVAARGPVMARLRAALVIDAIPSRGAHCA
jgi:DNA-binding transcriptional MocR family regulator